MAVTLDDVLFKEARKKAYLLPTHPRSRTCGSNPIYAVSAQDAVDKFNAAIAQFDQDAALGVFGRVPSPYQIAQKIDDKVQEAVDTLAKMHQTLILLNNWGVTDAATEAFVRTTGNQKAQAMKNAILDWKDHWKVQFADERAEAVADWAAWKEALKTFAANNDVWWEE